MKTDILKNITLINADCMDVMRTMPDQAFDLAIVDPPYGINMDKGTIGSSNLARVIKYDKKHWDKSAPTKEYFEEVFRVSKKQIIWGANHYIESFHKNSSCWIVWDKDNGDSNFSDCELAWTSFSSAVRKFKWRWAGMLQEDMKNKEKRIHPTQKPVELYKWLLRNYAKPGDKILDTHLGSGSICIACDDLGFDMTGIELDPDYYQAAKKRIIRHQAQQKLF